MPEMKFYNEYEPNQVEKNPLNGFENKDTNSHPEYKKCAKNLVSEICVSMILLNNSFLDDLLDSGLVGRYTNDSGVFLIDLKNLIIAKNRLFLGRFDDNGHCYEDTEISKLNNIFSLVEFDINKNWKTLIDARNCARNIITKLLFEDKLNSYNISRIYWIGPNKTDEYDCDIILELKKDDKLVQYSISLNSNISNQKSMSFNTFADDILSTDVDFLYQGEYLQRWDELVRCWVRLIYEYSNNVTKKMIECFIDPNLIDNINYYNFYNIKHKKEDYKYLGQFFPILDKNIVSFSDLLEEIWKNKDKCIRNISLLEKEWNENKVLLLNSKILEDLFTKSFRVHGDKWIVDNNSGWLEASNELKMSLMKTIVNKFGCKEYTQFHFNKNGEVFNIIPSKDFFRTNYDDLRVKFKYHVKFNLLDDDKYSDVFNFDIECGLDNYLLLKMFVNIGMTSGQMSGKLSAKIKYELPTEFNYMIQNKISNNLQNQS